MSSVQSIAPKIRPMQLDKFYSASLGGTALKDEWAYYKIDLSQLKKPLYNNSNTPSGDGITIDDEWDFVLQVESRGDKFSDPNLFILLTSDQQDMVFPTLQNYTFRCAFYGEDYCVISYSELKQQIQSENVHMVVGVYCYEECDFRLQGEISEQLLLDTGRAYKLYFQKDQERIVKFSIPNDPNITTIEIKGTNQNKFGRFNMIMTQGNKLPTSENALYLRPAWENGYTGKFTEDCSCFCRGCNYTVLVSAESEGYITVGAKYTGQAIDLSTHKSDQGDFSEIYDSVLFYHSQCYSYTVSNPDKDLRIKLESFAGDPNIYVNPLNIPVNLGLSVFNSRDHFDNEELVLTPSERAQHNATVGLYYICIFGNTAATYKLTVTNQEHDLYLHPGLSESGYIDSNETLLYYFRDPILASTDAELTFQLHVMTGKARLKAKLCEIKHEEQHNDFKDKCTLTTADMLEEDPGEKQEQHVGSESIKPEPGKCTMPTGPNMRDASVSCVYVIGVIGMADYQSHYSVLLKVSQGDATTQHSVLKEGVPALDEILETTPQYYLVSLHNPNITRLTFQLTTIHGDPDLFISRTDKALTPQTAEKRSIRCGIYPEQVIYELKEELLKNKTLEGDYYILIYGYVQSTYSLVYFTETADSAEHLPKIRLVMGQRQKGVIKSAEESMLYYFRLSNDIKEDIQLRLQSENGHYSLYLGQGFIPTDRNFTLQGDDRRPLVFSPKGNVSSSDDQDQEVITYFVRVYPIQFDVKEVNQLKDSAGMANQYSIAFYEQGSFIHLVEGIPSNGLVTKDTFDYYVLDLPEDQNDETAFEITLTPKMGNPDLVLSLDTENKFPTLTMNDFMSANQFTVDSIIIDKTMIQNFQKKIQETHNTIAKVSQIYIGVYTNDTNNDCLYSILVTKKQGAPIHLTNGQVQNGQISKGEKKYYYFKTSSHAPIYTSLTPKVGNPDLSIYVLTDMTLSMFEWVELIKKQEPDFVSKSEYDADIIYLDSNINQNFKTKCGSSCILLIQVDNSQSEITSHYAMQVSRDILELPDADYAKFSDTVRADYGYKYYKFYKACDSECDMEITVEPKHLYQPLLMLVDVADTVNGTLPTKTGNVSWIKQVWQKTSLVIQGDDQALLLKKGNNTTKGTLFILGIYTAQSDTDFTIMIHTFPHVTKEQIARGDHLGLTRLYLGEESSQFTLFPSQIRYFFFENWSNQSVKFQYFQQQQQINVSQNQNFDDEEGIEMKLEMEVTSYQGKVVPKENYALVGAKWINNENKYFKTNQLKDSIQVDYRTENFDFCIQCYFILRVQNLNKAHDAHFTLLITQIDDQNSGFYSQLIVGKPHQVKLSKSESAHLYFKLQNNLEEKLTITVQYFTGSAQLEVSDSKSNLIEFEIMETMSSTQVVFPNGLHDDTYALKVHVLTELHASVIVSVDSSLQIVSDGIQKHLTLAKDQPIYFLYLPPSPKFQLAVHSSVFTQRTDYSLYLKKFSSASNSTRMLHNNNRQLVNTPQDSQIWGKVMKNYDYKLSPPSVSGGSSNNIYEYIPITMRDEEDSIIIMATSNEENTLQMELTISGSQVQFIYPGQTVRGHVSNFNQTYKIYELHVNKAKLESNNVTDLIIDVIPCNGRVHFFISDNYTQLFSGNNNKGSKNHLIDMVTETQYGKLTSRLNQVTKPTGPDVYYIGITSSNEFYQTLEKQLDSYFELKVTPVSSNSNMAYTFNMDNSQTKGTIQIETTNPSDSVIIRWSPIFKQPNNAGGLQSQPLQPLDSKLISYQIYAGQSEETILTLNSKCAIEHASSRDIFAIDLSAQDEQDRSVSIPRGDLENVMVIAVIATIRDPQTHQLDELAYEPLLLHQQSMQQQLYGVKLQPYQLIMIITLAVLSMFCMGFVVYCLRRKALRLRKRLDYEVSYQEHQSSADFTVNNNT